MPTQPGQDYTITFDDAPTFSIDVNGNTLIDGVRYIDNYPVSSTIPVLTNTGWEVANPGGHIFATHAGMLYWCEFRSQPFSILRPTNTEGGWTIDWGLNPANLIPDVEESFVDEELVAEFDDYEYNEPFEYGNGWYVVMRDDWGNGQNYSEGQVWFSSREDCEFRLGRGRRPTLFGSHDAFRIQWVDHHEEEMHLDDGYSVEREEVDTREIAPVLSTNIGREIPLVSIEQEFSGNGDMVANRLFRANLAYSRHADGYHSSEARYEDNIGDRICYVETDSSCGYELIFSKINLKSRSEAEKISQAQEILRELKNEGNIRLSARCGFHIHVDVREWGMKEIVSAYHLWNYMEDTIFRFSSAFWNHHRDEEVGGGYSTPVPKGYTGRASIATSIMERRDALNFSHILRAKTNCRCGASVYEDWANCSCNLNQPTLEFRVFNATLNQRKIRAYLAFCVAFVNIAKEHNFTPDEFPEMRWRGTERNNSIAVRDNAENDMSWEELSKERMSYILKAFPLTNSEKSDIAYCFRNSSLEPVMELL